MVERDATLKDDESTIDRAGLSGFQRVSRRTGFRAPQAYLQSYVDPFEVLKPRWLIQILIVHGILAVVCVVVAEP